MTTTQKPTCATPGCTLPPHGATPCQPSGYPEIDDLLALLARAAKIIPASWVNDDCADWHGRYAELKAQIDTAH